VSDERAAGGEPAKGLDWVLLCPRHGVRAEVTVAEDPAVGARVGDCSLLSGPGAPCGQSCMDEFLLGVGGRLPESARIREVLVPVVAGRETAAVVLWHVRRLLGAPGSEALLLGVVPPGAFEAERTAARRDLEALTGELRQHGVRAASRLVAGDPAAEVVARARASDPSLVVVATGGGRGDAAPPRGSVAEKLLRRAPAPLLLFQAGTRTSDFRRILVPLDGSGRSARILPLAAEVARAHRAEVVLLGVADPGDEAAAAAAAEALEPGRAALELGRVPVTRRVARDRSPAHAILAAAEELEVDLIAMTSHGRSHRSLWPLGSVAEHVLRYAPLPLLLERVVEVDPVHLEAPPAAPASGPAAEASPARDPGPSRLLVPVDGSALSDDAISTLPRLLQGRSAEVTLLRVLGGGTRGVAASHEEVVAAEAHLDGLRDRLAERGVTADRRVARGDPAARILAVARELDPDLLVMSTHGRSGVARWVRGSVAERVLRHADAPVFLCTPRVLEEESWRLEAAFQRIVVPLDASDLGVDALPHVEELARLHGAEVVLVHVVAPGGSDEEEAGRAAARESIAVAKGLLEGAEVEVTVRVEVGDPVEQILKVARSANLVALATHGRSGTARWWFGSVAEQVLRRCSRPLLVVRGREEGQVQCRESRA